MKHEVVCIKRNGYSILNTEGGDFAAKVTYFAYEPGKIYGPREGIRQEWLVPLPGRWPE